jgi:hypothetical protein
MTVNAIVDRHMLADGRIAAESILPERVSVMATASDRNILVRGEESAD